MNKLLEIIKLFSRKQKLQFITLFVVTILVALIVASGVGAVFPIVSMFVNPDLILDTSWGQWVYAFVRAKDNADFTVKLLAVYCAVFILMQASFITLNLFQNWFIQNLLLDFRKRMLTGYAAKNYSFFLKNNSAVMLKNILNETGLFVTSLALSLLKMMTNAITLLVIGGIVVYVNPKIAIAAAVIGSIFFSCFYILIQRQTKNWGKERDYYFSGINKTAHLVLSGISLIKTYQCQRPFMNSYVDHLKGYATTTIKYQTVSASTPFVFNMIVYGTAFLGVLIAKYYQIDIIDLIPSLVFYGVGFSKIFPCAINLFNDAISMRYHWASLENVYDALSTSESDLEASQDGEVPPKTLSPMENISFENVSYSYPNAKNCSLQRVSFTIDRGKRIGFVGKSGAGKSTAINLLLGLISDQSGEVSIDGVPLDATTISSWRDQLGYVPQDAFLIDSSLKANIALTLNGDDVDENRLDYAIKTSRLAELVATLPHGTDELVGERGVKLSGGEKQRIAIARALYRQPNILIMDEPTSALDPITEKQIIDDVLSGIDDITILIVTHRLQSVRSCDTIFFFEDGRISASGTYAELHASNPEFKTMNEVWEK